MDAAINADNREQLQVEETDDSCIVDFIEIVPLARDTDGSYSTDWSADAKQENLVAVKQEPDDVCCVLCVVVVVVKFFNKTLSNAK